MAQEQTALTDASVIFLFPRHFSDKLKKLVYVHLKFAFLNRLVIVCKSKAMFKL